MKAYFDHSEKITHNISSFFFRTETKFDYEAGQYSDIRLSGIPSRTYTFSSAPSESLLALTTKFTGEISPFKKALKNLKAGSEVSFTNPLGDFALPKDPSVPLIFICGGIGITPARSIVKFLSDKDEQRSIQLIYAVNNEKDLAYNDLFKDYDLIYIPVISSPSTDLFTETGKLTTERVLSLTKIDKRSLIFVSGPRVMVETICYELAKTIERGRIVMDYFPGYTSI